MSKPFDVVLKVLVENGPEGWPKVSNLPTGPTTVIDADVSTVGGAVDKGLRVEASSPYLLHLDFFTGHDTARAPAKLRWYNAVLDYRHDLPVESVAVLLRPEADSPQLTGELIRGYPNQPPRVIFRYEVLRVWQQPAEVFLKGPLGLLPLATVSAANESQLPAVIERMKQRLSQRKARSLAGELWTAAWVLLGMRYSQDIVGQLLGGISAMEESSTFQYIVQLGEAKGRVQGARETLVLFGTKQFGTPPSAEELAAIQAIPSAEALEQLAVRLFDVQSWQELLAPPTRPRRARGRRP